MRARQRALRDWASRASSRVLAFSSLPGRGDVRITRVASYVAGVRRRAVGVTTCVVDPELARNQPGS